MPVTLDQVDVSDLTGSERAVALYASDMPNGRGSHSRDEVREWIAQGVERVGVRELRRSARYRYGYRLLELAGMLTPEIRACHTARFPDPKRLRKAGQESSNSVYGDGMTGAALRRNAQARTEGECPCGGSGRIAFRSPDFDPYAAYERECPVHAPRRGTASWVRGGAR
ncbi:hypothetical protein DF268_19165 [Streptomyces sp. V2]|nr:hypothetical protein DF268_19165 [Streptomyces sp. V2]